MCHTAATAGRARYHRFDVRFSLDIEPSGIEIFQGRITDEHIFEGERSFRSIFHCAAHRHGIVIGIDIGQTFTRSSTVVPIVDESVIVIILSHRVVTRGTIRRQIYGESEPIGLFSQSTSLPLVVSFGDGIESVDLIGS